MKNTWVLTSLHEGIEERGVGEEEEIGEELGGDLRVHLEGGEQPQGLLQDV